MGIRFLCDACGHKLNVKSFLAGKRGVCPQCGGGLDIPYESQVGKQSQHVRPVSVAAGFDARPAAGAAPRDDANAAPEVPDLRTALPTSGEQKKARKPLSRRAAVPVLNPSLGGTPEKLAADSGPLAVPMQPVSVPQPIQPAIPVASPVQPAPAEPAPVDPIDEAPDAIWYIRPPSGGQYGPARGEIMRKWMGEGRVSADSLVWREGWSDWCTAADIFPSLGAGMTPPAPAGASPASFAGSPVSPTSPRSALRPRRRNSAVLAVTVVSVLGLMCVALFVALIMILMN